MPLPKSFTTVTPFSKGLALTIFILFPILAFFLGMTYQESMMNIKITQLEEKLVQLSRSPTPTPNLDIWDSHQIKTVGLEFKIPSTLSAIGELKETILLPPKGLEDVVLGSEICVRLSKKGTEVIQTDLRRGCFPQNTDLLLIGGSSINFEAPREGHFTELQGFKYENGNYYAKFNRGKTGVIPQELTKQVNNPYGVQVIKLKGRNFDTGFGLYGDLREGWVGALINTNNTTYPGLAVQAEMRNINEETFDQILSTFKFTDQNPTPTCTPRPACLDATPRCLMPELENMCPPKPTGQTACTQEAKLCPDGSYVNRTGPNCEFAACPQ